MIGGMEKFYINNSKIKEAEFLIFGIPDDSGSSYKKGSALAPDAMRSISNKNQMGIVIRAQGNSLLYPDFYKFNSKISDMGNISKKEKNLKDKIGRKLPIFIGGDHSITYHMLKQLRPDKEWSFIYFDAHPDFMSSKGSYFGSVVNDLSQLPNVNMKSSFIIGARVPEGEEIINIKKSKINLITSYDFVKIGAQKILERVLKTASKNVYMSIDLDVMDMVFAPGVTTPEPGGISSNELIYLVRELAHMVNIGFDITELCPSFDNDYKTTYIAYKLMLEFISAKSRKIG